jgi:cytidylate kinase
MHRPLLIAIDGPTASGKGTLAKRIADIFGLKLLDTGLLYRAVGLALLDQGGDPRDACLAEAVARGLDLERLDDPRLRSSVAGAAASIVAAHEGVRSALFTAQRAFASDPRGAVLDGRDIGTVICPDAQVKLYVTASLEARAERRFRELQGRGESLSLDTVTQLIAERDSRDMNRAVAPLRPAHDAVLLDTSDLTIEEAVAAARRLIEAAQLGPGQ